MEGGAFISSELEVHCMGHQGWGGEDWVGIEGRKSQTTVCQLRCSEEEAGLLGQGCAAPQPPGMEKEYCLTVRSRLSSGSTVTGYDKYDGFKASAPKVPRGGLLHCPSHPETLSC